MYVHEASSLCVHKAPNADLIYVKRGPCSNIISFIKFNTLPSSIVELMVVYSSFPGGLSTCHWPDCLA